MDNDERDKMEKAIKNLSANQKRQDKKKVNRKDNDSAISSTCNNTNTETVVEARQSDVLIPTQLINSTDTNTNLPMDVVCTSVPTELITSTDTNTNLPMDVECSCVNVTQSVVKVSATTTNIIVNIPSSIQTQILQYHHLHQL